MSLKPEALLLRIDVMRKKAMEDFKPNRYVTIHDYSNSASPEKRDPFSVWIDLNYPVYVLSDGRPILQKQGVKDICIKFKTTYPDERPTVILPMSIASIHVWKNNTACTHARYNPADHHLVKEISNIMTLCANCPEGINYNSPTPDHEWLIGWTKRSLANGTLPTVPYKELFTINKTTSRRDMRRV